jgi:hypothetical protein
VLLRFTASGYLGHCIACAYEIYGFWLYCLFSGYPLWHLHTFLIDIHKLQRKIKVDYIELTINHSIP